MRIVAQFNPTSALSGSFNASTLQVGSKLLIINKSYVDLVFSFSSGVSSTIMANDRKLYCFDNTTGVPSAIIMWEIFNIDNPQTINQLTNTVIAEVFDPGEPVPPNQTGSITRQPTPNIIPYNVGFGSASTGLIAANGTVNTIWPSSYAGLTIAPSGIGGLNYDHFYYQYSPGVTANWLDMPGHYTSTGKTAADLVPRAAGGSCSVVPGPFSLGGLTPVDSATFFNNFYFSFPSVIPWASSVNGFFIDFWVNYPNFGDAIGYQNLFGDGDSTTTGGLNINIAPNGMLTWTCQYVGGSVTVGSGILSTGSWHYVACLYTGTTTNTMSIWTDGQLSSQATTSGAPVNSVNPPRLGSNTFYGGLFYGSMANIGIKLNTTTTGRGLPSSKFLLAEQSLNKDYQMGWLSSWELFTITAPASTLTYSFSNVFNPAGLFYVNTDVEVDSLHTMPAGTTLSYAIPLGSAYDKHIVLANPVTSFASSVYTFINFNGPNLAGVSFQVTIYGHNILGIL